MQLCEIDINTVIKDVASVIEYVQEQGSIPTVGKNSVFPASILSELNRRMSHPITIDQKRPRQASYPLIDVIYMLLRSLGILVIQKRGRAKVLLIQSDELEK